MVSDNGRFFAHELPNGLGIAIERMKGVRSAAAGFLCRTGARDETPEVAGVSHFLEHMCFKGTEKRTAAEINIDFDRIGGQPNAFTSHDRTFYHGVSRVADIETQIEIIADMMRSTLPPDEFDMEKNVVLEEIAMAGDRIEHVAFDLVIEKVFAGNSLGWPVLGYDHTVKALTREQMAEYFHRRYTAENVKLVVAGDVDPRQVVELADKYCGAWERGAEKPARATPRIHTGQANRTMDRFSQQIVAISFAAPGGPDPVHDTAEAVASILGGGNSRFYWNIEQTGLCPHAGAYRLDFADCGLLILMAQCDPANTDKVIDAMRTEARKIMEGPISDAELQRVKNKRRTSLAVEGESPYYRLVQVMDDVDYRGRPRTIEERLAAVDAVDRDSIRDYFAQYPIDHDGYLVSVGPRGTDAG
jgi:predicted Zn-dependent peptidase